MSDPALALQGALIAALRNQTDAGANVFDEVPPSDPFPRITLGEGQTIGNRADCYDGSEVFLEINVWSRPGQENAPSGTVGFPPVKRIAAQARSVLDDAELVLDGHILELLEFQDTVYSRDPDGKTRRARMTLRALTQTA